MTYIALTGGAYESRSIIASAQRCLNLYVEPTPQATGEPLSFTHYPTPGLSLLRAAPQDICRCLYRATNGDLYACYGQSVYYVNSSGVFTLVGTFSPSATSDATPRTTPVSMADNGSTMIVVDGSVDGWTVTLATRSGWSRIVSTGFYGADFVCYLDTFFILNKPGTPVFYVSGSEAVTFDPLDFASKVTMADPLVAVVSLHSVLVMVGERSWESWQNTGGDGTSAGSFPFSRLPGNYGNVGCIAKFSIASTSNTLWFLSQDASGRGIIMQGNGYDVKRVSTFAIETQISAYGTISDCVAYTYQQQGHTFVVFNFPSANDSRGATWVFDATVEQWHERAWIDTNGIEWRHRGAFAQEAYGINFVGDWQTANLYSFDLNNYTDNGSPIKRLRSFPHQIDTSGNRRVMYHQLIANMQVGTGAASAGSVSEVIHTSFVAADGTLLQNYSNVDDIGATFTKLSGINSLIVSDSMTATANGSPFYRVAGTPTVADYSLTFNVRQSSYSDPPNNGSIIFAVARANGSNNGYKAAVSSNGSSLSVSLTVMPSGTPATVALGTLASGYYRVSVTLVSTSISVTVYRSADGYWLAYDGSWSGSEVTAIQISDSTYTLPGRILVGGTWS